MGQRRELTMQATNHMDFIAGAYAAAIVVVGGLIAWVLLDYRAQVRKLADLEKRGVTRRSAAGHAEPTVEQAREDA
ncbi:MAG: heme exporter protein CcmD [Xanthobacteraceae bacterium]